MTKPKQGASWSGVMESPPGAQVKIDGRSYLYFAGTAYCGLQGHPAVIRAGCDAFQLYGVNTATSRGGFGACPPLLDVERYAAELFQSQAAFHFVSGYWGNNITVGALRNEFDVIFYDEHSHYSILEAIQLAGCPAHDFQHRNAIDLRTKLADKLAAGQRPLVISDGVFASSGRIAPIDEYYEILEPIAGSILVLDDAHAVGVLGGGKGTFSHYGIPFSKVNRHPDELTEHYPRLYCNGTLSKAIGGNGGIIAGSSAWIAHLKANSRYYNAASIPCAPIAASTAAALKQMLSDPSIHKRQQENALLLRSGLKKLGFNVEQTSVPFTAVVVRDAAHMQMMHQELRSRGLIVAYARSYSGVPSTGQLRIAVSSVHTETMIQRLLQEMASLL